MTEQQTITLVSVALFAFGLGYMTGAIGTLAAAAGGLVKIAELFPVPDDTDVPDD